MALKLKALPTGTLDELAALEAAEAAIEVTFVLPDGSKSSQTFKAGQPIEMLKVAVQTKHDIPYGEQKLTLNGKELPDPLSLNDVPEIVGKKAIEVKVSKR
eukprot:tig00000615_g2586.t1